MDKYNVHVCHMESEKREVQNLDETLYIRLFEPVNFPTLNSHKSETTQEEYSRIHHREIACKLYRYAQNFDFYQDERRDKRIKEQIQRLIGQGFIVVSSSKERIRLEKIFYYNDNNEEFDLVNLIEKIHKSEADVLKEQIHSKEETIKLWKTNADLASKKLDFIESLNWWQRCFMWADSLKRMWKIKYMENNHIPL